MEKADIIAAANRWIQNQCSTSVVSSVDSIDAINLLVRSGTIKQLNEDTYKVVSVDDAVELLPNNLINLAKKNATISKKSYY